MERTIEIPVAAGHINCRVVHVSGFRNRLLATRLSAPAPSCQALFLIAIWFFDGRSLRIQIMIAWAPRANFIKGKRFPALPIAERITFASVTLAPETVFVEENAWATQ